MRAFARWLVTLPEDAGAGRTRHARPGGGVGSMMRGVKKADLPTKTCPVCGLPFAWRKKWAKTWDVVRYCSERCKRGATGTTRG